MIGLLPLNSQEINGGGAVGVWHVASATATATATVVDPVAVRARRARSRGNIAAAQVTIAAPYSEKVWSASALARAIRNRMTPSRGRVASAGAMVAASASAGPWSNEKVAVPLPAQARAHASPAGMLVNANYLVVSIVAKAQAIATIGTQVMMTMRSAYVAARATGNVRPFVSRTMAPSKAVARATASHRAVRQRPFSGRTLARADAVAHKATVDKVWSAAALVRAIIRRATGAFVRPMSATGKAQVIASADMVTWMYVHEPDYRTVFVRNDASTTRMQTFRKQPAEILPYDIDFAEWLAPLIGDDVESTEVYVSGAVNGSIDDLNIDRVVLLAKDIYGVLDIQASRVKVWLSGGNHGATYKITVRADTEGGRRKEVDFRLMVREV